MALQGSLAGMAALVTGGGSGIGFGCAARLVADSAHVTICGRADARLAAAAKELEARAPDGVKVQAIVADVTDEAAVVRAVEAATELNGRLDAVVASAGGSETIGPITQIDVDAFRRTLDVNVVGTFLTLKHAGRVMARQEGGSFVGISSIAASNTHRWFGAYGVAKSGIDHLCKLAADELGAGGVRVNSIRPGLVRTELVGFILEQQSVLDDYLACMPISRVGHVEDIADLARFLVGPESRWITGQAINCDGGHSLRRGPDFSSAFEPLFGADGLRGVVPEDADAD